MKLLLENWRKYLNEGHLEDPEKVKELYKQYPDAIDWFYEWLVHELKNKVFIEWIKIHKERTKYVAALDTDRDPYDRTTEPAPIIIDEPNYTHCSDDIFGVPDKEVHMKFPDPGFADVGDTDGEYWRARRRWRNKIHAEEKKKTERFDKTFLEVRAHIDKIKKKFPYDVFTDLKCTAQEDWRCYTNQCKEKLELLDALVWATIRCPYMRPAEEGAAMATVKEGIDDVEGKLTPYEICAARLKNLHAAEKEVSSDI